MVVFVNAAIVLSALGRRVVRGLAEEELGMTCIEYDGEGDADRSGSSGSAAGAGNIGSGKRTIGVSGSGYTALASLPSRLVLSHRSYRRLVRHRHRRQEQQQCYKRQGAARQKKAGGQRQ